ncbi:MAG TPA: hypothetical protein VN026_17180 [Bacteroidia bacterium]|jgi:hypothetical protein|nr:hypothetical protein [Bacteroidia bacterium]
MKKIKLYTEEQVAKLCYAVEDACLEVPESKITTSSAIKEFIDDNEITEIPVIFPSRKTDFSSYKHYRRFPIQLGAQSIILIHHFKASGGFDQSFESHDFQEENQEAFEYGCKENEIATKQFFDQLEGHYCDAFLGALIIEATKKLNESDARRLSYSKKLGKECDFDNRAKKALDKAYELIKTT